MASGEVLSSGLTSARRAERSSSGRCRSHCFLPQAVRSSGRVAVGSWASRRGSVCQPGNNLQTCGRLKQIFTSRLNPDDFLPADQHQHWWRADQWNIFTSVLFYFIWSLFAYSWLITRGSPGETERVHWIKLLTNSNSPTTNCVCVLKITVHDLN